MMRDFDMDNFLHDNYVTISYESQPIGPDKIVLYLTTFDMERYEKEQILEKKVDRLECDTSFASRWHEIETYRDVDGYLISPARRISDKINALINDTVAEYYGQKVMGLQNKIDEYNSKLEMQCHARDIFNNVTNADQVFCDVIKGDVTNCDEVHCNNIKGDLINCIVYKDGERE